MDPWLPCPSGASQGQGLVLANLEEGGLARWKSRSVQNG